LPQAFGSYTGVADLDSLRALYRQEAAQRGGGIVCVEIVQAEGVQSVKVINKYERRPAYAYEGRLIIPFRNAEYTITMDSVERGVTGERDAVVTAALAQGGQLEIEIPEPSEEGRIKGWFQDPYDASYQGAAIYSMSDDDRVDVSFHTIRFPRYARAWPTYRTRLSLTLSR
jgi:hypothetical protein